MGELAEPPAGAEPPARTDLHVEVDEDHNLALLTARRPVAKPHRRFDLLCLIRHNIGVDAADLIRNARQRHGLSQGALALRAGTDQAAVSRIERGQVSPSIETVERLLAAMRERLRLGSEPLERDYDQLHMRATLHRTPAERLELAISWNRLAGRLTEAGRHARAS